MPYQIMEICTGCTACVSICPVAAISGARKERHRIEQALCIDCGACGRICTYQAVVDAAGNPELGIKRSAWPRPQFHLDSCCACTECVLACLVSRLGLALQVGRKTTLYPFLSNSKTCIACGFCEQVCSLAAVTMVAGTKG